MKKYLLTLVTLFFIAFSMQSYAQTEAGRAFFGGKSSLSYSSKSLSLHLDGEKQKIGTTSQFNLSPQIGFFVSDGLAIGFMIDVTSQKETSQFSNDEAKLNTFVAGPLLRYYVGSDNVKPFLHCSIGLASEKTDIGSDSESLNGFGYELGGGIAFFLNQNVSLDLSVGYSAINVSNDDLEDIRLINGGLDFNFGFNIFL